MYIQKTARGLAGSSLPAEIEAQGSCDRIPSGIGWYIGNLLQELTSKQCFYIPRYNVSTYMRT
jgi:hypothetical protein